MNLRKYNIYFHTHTISGILIAGLLYVIFFAGSFSFFRDDLTAWQLGRTNSIKNYQPKLNPLLDSLATVQDLSGRSFDFYMSSQGSSVYVYLSVSNDSTLAKSNHANGRSKRNNFRYFFRDKTAGTYADSYEIGEFLYRLHFLAPLNQIPVRLGIPFGYLLAGIVSFMFLFALITGLLIHWDKIKTNFFLIRTKGKWKTIWTDFHTVLGVIGFPFQLIYAVTGIILIANTALILPYSKILYQGKEEKLLEAIGAGRPGTPEYRYQRLKTPVDVDELVGKWLEKWPENHISRLFLRNFGDESMEVILETKPDTKTRFAGSGLVHFRASDSKILKIKSPVLDVSYADRVKSVIYRLHFGDFGGRPLRLIFFVLGICGCLVIASGVSIWWVARNKITTTERKRRFNFWATNLFLASSLSMLPVTAFTLVVLKVLNYSNQNLIYSLYFYSWLILTVYFSALRSFTTMNKHLLVLSAILCAAVPVTNGLLTENWLWKSASDPDPQIFFVDLLFTTLAACCLFTFRKVTRNS